MYRAVSLVDERLGIFTQAVKWPFEELYDSISWFSLFPLESVKTISLPFVWACATRPESVMSTSTGKLTRLAAIFVWSIVTLLRYFQAESDPLPVVNEYVVALECVPSVAVTIHE